MRISLRPHVHLLVKYLSPHIGQVATLAVLLGSSIGLQLLNPQVTRRFIDLATSGEPVSRLTQTALVFLLLILLQQMISVGATYVSERVGWSAMNRLRGDLVRHCLHLDMPFHTTHSAGELIERVDGDVSALANFFSQFVIQLLGNALVCAGILALLFRESWQLGLAMTGFAILTLLIFIRLRYMAVPHWRAAREASAQLFGFLEERLAGMEDIQTSSARQHTLNGLFQRMRNLWRTSIKAWLTVNVMMNVMWILAAVANALAFIISAGLFRSGVLTLGGLYVVFYYTNVLIEPIRRITQQLEDFQTASGSLTRIQELFQTQSRVVDPGANGSGPGVDLPSTRLAVEFRDVSFGYRAAESVLAGLSFSVRPGTVLGLLGRTGSGKTTIARLLLRLYEPTEGAVLLNGIDICQVPLKYLRQRVALVTQNVQLFQATLRDNLTFFDRTIPESKILQVLESLGLSAWQQSLPRGLDTLLGKEAGLSAGEAQLVALTRVFLKDPGLVILDEASARLDPATERLIQQAIHRLAQRCTIIIIAHRLLAISQADEVMILDKGRIQEYGAREHLLQEPSSRFAQLLRMGVEELDASAPVAG